MSAKNARSAPVIVRLLQGSRPKLTELPRIQQMIESYARSCGDALLRVASLASAVLVEAFEQEEAKAVSIRVPGTIVVMSFVPYWNARIIVRFDRTLLIRALDAMYGGDPKKLRSTPPVRALTPLERSVATRIARGLAAELLIALGEVERCGSTEEHLVEPGEQESHAGAKLAYVVASLKLVDLGEQLIVGFPASALERLAEQLVTKDTQEEHVVDLDWTQQFRRNVERSTIELVAKIEGPRLLVSDIAALRPGSLIELNREFFQNVTLVAGGRPVFKGRLGQSRGNFTVLLDRPLSPSHLSDDQS
jgi:flagellar motor switch protein FliM